MKKATAVLITAAGLLAGCVTSDVPSDAGTGSAPADSATAIAEEAFIYTFPILESYKMMFAQAVSDDTGVPFNAVVHNTSLLGPDYTLIVRPNNDTLYSAAWLDLRAEPMVLAVPAVPPERYYSFQMIDLLTHNFGYVGSRATGTEAGHYLIAGPRWQGRSPDDIDGVFRAMSDFVLALGRTEVFGAGDIANVAAIQQGYALTPLSEFAGTTAPAAAPALQLDPYDPSVARSAGFVDYVNALLPYIQPDPSESVLWDRFAAIGIGDANLQADTFLPDTLAAIDTGVAAAVRAIEAESGELGREENGWDLTADAFGTPEAMLGRPLTRAAAAYFGLFGNTLEEAYYPTGTVDGDGELLDGSRHDYVLHFEAADLPPANAFWSLSMYRLPEMWFMHNPIDRYRIGNRTEGLRYGDDGSLRVYIQRESPGADRESNWLPAEDGPFDVTLRIYWPDPEALDPLYVPPPIRKSD